MSRTTGARLAGALVLTIAVASAQSYEYFYPGLISTPYGTSAGFNEPVGLAWYPDPLVQQGEGYLAIADTANHRIRSVNLKTGAISTLAGTGLSNFRIPLKSGDTFFEALARQLVCFQRGVMARLKIVTKSRP